MKFSIIIPVYNVENYLKKCLDSVLNQTYKNYEVIIICDKCNDNSEKIVDDYVSKYNVFKKIYKENTGLSIARNIGVENASGNYILFLDSDDYLESDLLEVLNNSIVDEDVIRFQAREIGNNIINHNEVGFKTLNGIEAFNKIINYHYIENSWLYAYNLKFYKKNKFMFKNNVIGEDYGLTPLIIYKANKIKSLSYIGYNYIQRDNSLMNTNDYNKKIKKINDLISQSMYLKDNIIYNKDNINFYKFINNSLIYYITTLNYKDYKDYKKILKKNNCFKHLNINYRCYPHKVLINIYRNIMLKYFTYFYYNKMVKK